MAQDFAKQRSKGKSTSQRRKSGAAPSKNPVNDGGHWSWFLSGLICGLFVAFIGYLTALRPGIVNQINNTVSETLAETANAVSNPSARFDFYEYLPEAEVQVDVVPVQTSEPQLVSDNVQYLLQAGSFQARADAESRRASILLMNFDARVVPGVVSGKTWHRVQVGPFIGKRAAEVARNSLASNNIDSIPLLMK